MKLATVKAVEIFAPGSHRDEEYTLADLQDIVRNYYRNRDVVRPPGVIGHEEEQEMLQNTGIPAVGRWVNPRLGQGKQGVVLLADLVEVPPPIARLINARSYRAVSSEIYDRPPEGCQGEGKMLRRVALLGGELPQIKSLADLPHAEFVEAGPIGTARLALARSRQMPGGTWRVFYEVRPMKPKIKQFSERCKAVLKKFQDEPRDAPDGSIPEGVSREDLVAALQEFGVDPAVLTDAVPDAVLAEMCRVLRLQAEAAEQMSDDDPEKKNGQQLYGSDEIRGKNQDAQRRAMWAKDPDGPDYNAELPGGNGGDRQPTRVALKYGEKGEIVNLTEIIQKTVAASLKPIREQTGATAEQVAKFHEAMKRNSIDAQLEDLVRQGKVLPAEIDAGLREQCYTMDAVKKYSDGKTQLDRFLDLLNGRPVLVKMAEAMKGGRRGAASGQEGDRDLDRVRRFSEEPGVQQALKAAGKRPADFVREFSEAKKKLPTLTAAQYGVPPDYH